MLRISTPPPALSLSLSALRFCLNLSTRSTASSSSAPCRRLFQTLRPTWPNSSFSFFSSANLRLRPPNSSSSSSASFSSSGEGREILVQHLLVEQDNLKLLLDLHKRVLAGEDLSDLAAEYSICSSKQQGGMLGWVRKGQMVPEFEEAAFSASLNKVVRCKTKFGWHLLQVLSEREESFLQNIQCKELHMKMQDPSFFDEAQLIDVREPEEVAQASLLGFQVLPLRQFGSWGPDIATKFDPQKDTYVMCHHGMRSLQVSQWLQTQGFKRVFNVAGGIHEYARLIKQFLRTDIFRIGDVAFHQSRPFSNQHFVVVVVVAVGSE